jgi:phosphoribosylformylglycinamidine synthase
MYLKSVGLEKLVPKFIVQVIIENKPYINDPEGETIHRDLILSQVCKDAKNARKFKNENGC